MIPRTLGSQLFFAMWSLALLLIAAAVAGSVSLIGGFVQQDVRRTLAAGRVGFAKYLDMKRTLMARIAESASSIPMLKATLGIEGLDRATASVAAEMVRELAGLDFCVLKSPEGTVLASTLSATGPDPVIDDREWLVALGGLPHVIETAEVTAGDVTIGRLILGRVLDHGFAGEISELTGSDAFLLFEGRLVARSAANTQAAPNAAEIGALREFEASGSETLEIGGLPCIATTISLPGKTEVVLTRSVVGLTELRRELMWVVAIGGLIGGLLALVFARLVASRIARPIRALTEASARFAGGDNEARVIPSGSLETEMLGTAFNAMVSDLDKARSGLVQAERLAAIGQIAVTMNHEMNNPLHGLLSTVEIASMLHRDDPSSPDLREALETIQENALQLRYVLNRITSLTEAVATEYVGDTSMIDIHRDED